MVNRKKVIALCGSTKQQSTNLQLLRAIQELHVSTLHITIFQGLTELPHFNPDLDTDAPPKAITHLRAQLKEAEGILICTPEYAMGVPGTLKNAIDWTVSSMEFSHKPVALITASSLGQKGHQSLLETLKIIESEIPESSQLLISFVKTKIKANKIVDPETLVQVNDVMDSLIQSMHQKINAD